MKRTMTAILFIFILTLLTAQAEAPPTALNDIMPVDPTVKIGRLDNGLTYYIRKNLKPEKRAELRLVINAGSILEDDDQQGLAHFAEHMAFNGTKNFEKLELVNYLESIGMRFGPDLNASTSFDETLYMLQVPTDSSDIVDTAFRILEEWAHNVSYDSEEIDKERGVIIEEWRLGRGADARMTDIQLPILLKDSKYAERLPIGKKEILESFFHDTMRRYYREWYRPDLMAVIAVGDFDTNRIEQLIKKHFSFTAVMDNPRHRDTFPVPDNKGTLFAIASDPEATGSTVSIYYKHDIQPENKVSDYRRSLVENIYNSLLNLRFDELTQKPDPPFLYAYSTKGRFIRTKDFYVLSAVVKDNGIETGLETLLTEAARVRKHGFTQSELDRQKKEMLRSIESIYNERDKTESGNYVSEYTRNFLRGEPIPGIEYEYELYKKYIPGITLDEINNLADTLIRDQNRVILVDGPEKEGVTIPNKEQLLAVFEKVNTLDIQPYVDSFTEKPLVSETLEPVQIVSESKNTGLGTTEWVLANGVRIVLKPTDFKNDEILFTSFSPGGYSLVPDSDYIPAATASDVIAQGGVGEFNQIELGKLLSGKIVSVSPYISSIQEGISGGASPGDIETMFQLIYEYFDSPRKDSDAFTSYVTRLKGYIENRSADPETAFSDTVMVTMANYHTRARPWTMKLLGEMNLDKSAEIYRDRFADAGEFVFFFVGNFELEQLKPLVQKYLGNLPATGRTETWRDTGIDPPDGVIKKIVSKGLEQKSRVNLIFTGPFDWSRQNRYNIQSMVSVLRIRLREILREDMGGTYGVGIGASTSHYPDEEYELTISFGCDPKRAEELIGTVLDEIKVFKSENVAETYINKVKESQRRERETSLKQNSFWLTNLSFYYFHGEDPNEILTLDTYIEKLTADDARLAAQKYFDLNNYVTVVLYPENE
ncbi:M16 family metallopeptidase [Candidatus Latescibacterota bacterium]